jgi:hypothetical protein
MAKPDTSLPGTPSSVIADHLGGPAPSTYGTSDITRCPTAISATYRALAHTDPISPESALGVFPSHSIRLSALILEFEGVNPNIQSG